MKDKRVFSIVELFQRIYLQLNHEEGSTFTSVYLRSIYYGITGKARNILQGVKNATSGRLTSILSQVVKPISSTRFLSRCQVALIDFRDVTIAYRWLLVYQDHFTKCIRLRLLKHMSAEEVSEVLEGFFCELASYYQKRQWG